MPDIKKRIRPFEKKSGNAYDLTRKADNYIVDRIVHHLSPKDDGIYLDLGCGTGNYTIALHKRGYKVVGLDPSEPMLSQAHEKCDGSVFWIHNFAETAPFLKPIYDGIFSVNAVHHFDDLYIAFNQVHRILRIGCKFVVFVPTHEQIGNYWLNHYFPETMKSWNKHKPSFSDIRLALEETGFSNIEHEIYHVNEKLCDFFASCCKHDPKRYLDEGFRNGMSTFFHNPNDSDIQKGCELLRKDIDTNAVKEVIDSYESNKGDCSFIICQKLNRK